MFSLTALYEFVATLKDAVKHFHDDYEKVKVELAAKKAECAEVEEQKKNLQKAYDNLTDEVSHIKSLRSSKPAGSTWENALTLIKTGGHSTSNTDNDDVSIFYNEVVSLKTQLEATAHEKGVFRYNAYIISFRGVAEATAYVTE